MGFQTGMREEWMTPLAVVTFQGDLHNSISLSLPKTGTAWGYHFANVMGVCNFVIENYI